MVDYDDEWQPRVLPSYVRCALLYTFAVCWPTLLFCPKEAVVYIGVDLKRIRHIIRALDPKAYAGMNRRERLEALRIRRFAAVALVCSGCGDDDVVQRARDVGPYVVAHAGDGAD